MIVNIHNNGKILKDRFNIRLPDLTILTGENGSGKTQLLEAFRDNAHGYWERHEQQMMSNPEENKAMMYPILSDDGSELKDITYSYPGLKNAEFEYHSEKPLIQQIREQWTSLKAIVGSYHLIKNNLFANEKEELDALNRAVPEFIKSLITDNTRLSESNFKKFTQYQLERLKSIGKQVNKTVDILTFTDFLIFYPVPTHVFSTALDLLFHQFHLKQKYYPNLTQSISPPWEVFNNLLTKADFKYTAQYRVSNNEDSIPAVTFIDNGNGLTVHINNLSSGEKTIMALIFVLYHASSNGKFPEVILFDEPDAHLHPSLTQLFLSVIQEVLVEQQKVKVILTTHSPSTIAIANPGQIFRMDRELGFPVQADQKRVIQELSNGLASVTIEDGTLGISFNLKKTAKHILFTEGITDKIIIEIAWRKLYPKREIPFFIQDCFSASFLGALFNEGDQMPDGIFQQFPEKKLIALFDFDAAGYTNWNRAKKFPNVIEEAPEKCLTRKAKNGYLLLLPSTDDESIRRLVVKKGKETFRDKSNLTIESLFLNVPNFKGTYFKEETVLGGSTIFIFNGNKRKFATQLEVLEPKWFKEFIPLFTKIECIIKDN